MLDQIKKAAKQTALAEVPARVMYGTVTAVSPLTVMVDSRFELTAPALVAPRPPRDHRHAHGTEKTGEDDLAGFEAGDQLVLLRNQGGQQYFIIGRV